MHADQAAVDAMRAQVAQLNDQLHTMTIGLADMQRRLQELSVTAESRDGLVSVTVGHDGIVHDLSFDSRIYDNADADRLARTVRDTIAVAVEEARRQAQEICSRYVSSETFDQLASGDLTGMAQSLRQSMLFGEG